MNEIHVLLFSFEYTKKRFRSRIDLNLADMSYHGVELALRNFLRVSVNVVLEYKYLVLVVRRENESQV